MEEDRSTFAGNAAKKASEYARAAGMHALADDSGLCIDALWGKPGIRSARWSEDERPGLSGKERDQANNEKLLMVMQGVWPEHRGAEYRAVVALAAPDGTLLASAEGSCRGRHRRGAARGGGLRLRPALPPRGRAREDHGRAHRRREGRALPPGRGAARASSPICAGSQPTFDKTPEGR